MAGEDLAPTTADLLKKIEALEKRSAESADPAERAKLIERIAKLETRIEEQGAKKPPAAAADAPPAARPGYVDRFWRMGR